MNTVSESAASHRDRRTRRREGRRLGRRDSVHQPRPIDIVRPPDADQAETVATAEGWAEAFANRDLDALVNWYDPQAVLHHEGDVYVDREGIRRCWETSPLLGRRPDSIDLVETEAPTNAEFDVVVRWVGGGADGVDVETRLRIDGSLVIEQWHGEVTLFEPVVGPPLEVSTSGRFTAEERERFTAMMWRVLDRVESDVRHAGLRLEHHADPARPSHFSARAFLQLDRYQIHARASAATTGALLDAVEHRLRLQLEERSDRRNALRRRGSSSPEGQWRHGDRPPPHARVPARAEDERAVIVRTTWAGGAESVDEALEDLDALDLEVLLFQEVSTQQPAVVWRDEHDRHHVRLASGADPHQNGADPIVAEVSVDQQAFPVMELDSARAAMSLGEPWVVFCDAVTGRAGVLYRRVDGHDGLVMLGSD